VLICSCAVVSDHDIELALLEIMIREDAPLPTPGVVWRHLMKKMECCGCAPLAVEIIYQRLEALQAKGLICPCACANVMNRMRKPPVKAAPATPPDRALDLIEA
jgi:bacterioferritin-associated ferredoxin